MILKESNNFTLKKLITGECMTHKWLILRIILSVLVGTIIFILCKDIYKEVFTHGNIALVTASIISTLLTYFIGFPWIIISILEDEIKKTKKESEERARIIEQEVVKETEKL